MIGRRAFDRDDRAPRFDRDAERAPRADHDVERAPRFDRDQDRGNRFDRPDRFPRTDRGDRGRPPGRDRF